MGEIRTDIWGTTEDGEPFHLWLGERIYDGLWAWEQWAYERNHFYLMRRCSG